MNKRTLGSQKLDEIKMKANILKAFVADKAEEVKEAVEEVVESATQRAKEEL